jgi:hypothetical protein
VYLERREKREGGRVVFNYVGQYGQAREGARPPLKFLFCHGAEKRAIGKYFVMTAGFRFTHTSSRSIQPITNPATRPATK